MKFQQSGLATSSQSLSQDRRPEEQQAHQGKCTLSLAMLIMQVLRYLQAFAEHHHLQQLIRFSTHVLQAVPVRATAAAGSADVPGLHVAVPTSQQHGQQQQQPSVQDSSAALPWQRWHNSSLWPVLAGEYAGQPMIAYESIFELLCIRTTQHHTTQITNRMHCTECVSSSTARHRSLHDQQMPMTTHGVGCVLGVGQMLLSQYACMRMLADARELPNCNSIQPQLQPQPQPACQQCRTATHSSAGAVNLEAGAPKQTRGRRWQQGDPCISRNVCTPVQWNHRCC
jgi:hypothetical protein